MRALDRAGIPVRERAPVTAIGLVQAVLTGRAVAFARPGVSSAIARQVRHGPVRLEADGFDGDEQGDRRVHGGPDKAVHVYALEHYREWIDELGPLPVLAAPGAFGENLAVSGALEHDVCLGDGFRIGSAVVQVSQARQPCWKLNHRFGIPDMARRVQDRGRTGWYCRVLRAGEVTAGDSFELVSRPFPDWPLSRLLDCLYRRRAEDSARVLAAGLPLVPSWRRLFERRMATNRIEDWRARLGGAG